MSSDDTIRVQVIGNSYVLTRWFTEQCCVQVHMDRIGSLVLHCNVTFWIAENSMDGGSCSVNPGDDWDYGLERVKWWLSGRVKYRANKVLPLYGYAAMYCTQLPGCSCEIHTDK
ncbi:hypothetical protein ACFU99_00805 [Streptomyces sp. NPDC057654]|uniref:hypothetical protein n=1 Tax=Streptomyces sp. NPDC057654 TaxID=3346196 RepID=UPI0036C63A83